MGTKLLMALAMIGALTLAACSKDPGEAQRDPGAHFRPGGDAVIGGAR